MTQGDLILTKTTFDMLFVKYNDAWILNNEVKSFCVVHEVRAAYYVPEIDHYEFQDISTR